MIGLNTAQIKDRAREKGINLSDQQAQDILKQAWNQSMWGADPAKVESILSGYGGGGGGGGGSSVSTVSMPTGVPTISNVSDLYIQNLQKLKSQPSDIQSYIDQLQQIGKQYQDIAEQQAKAVEAQIPLISQIYSNLAKLLQGSQQAETEAAQKEGQYAIGREKAALASEGVSAATGAAYAPVAEKERQLTQNLKAIADKYNLKYENLALEEKKDIDTLINEANNYRQQGLDKLANITAQIVNLKLQQEQNQQQLAMDLAKTTIESEKAQLQAYYDNLNYQLKQKELELAAQKLEEERRHNIETEKIQREEVAVKAAKAGSSELETAKTLAEIQKIQSDISSKAMQNVNDLIKTYASKGYEYKGTDGKGNIIMYKPGLLGSGIGASTIKIPTGFK